MSLDDVKQRLEQQLKDKTLHLDAATSGVDKLGTLLQLIGATGFELGSVTIKPGPSTLTVSGTGSFWKVASAAITVEFRENNGAVAVTISATPADGWQLKDSFPDLPATPGLDESLLSSVTLKSMHLILTDEADTGPLLSVAMTISADSAPALVRIWLGDGDVEFKGRIEPAANPPSLQVTTPSTLTIGNAPILTDQFEVQFSTALLASEAGASTVTLRGNTAIGANINTPMQGALPLESGYLVKLASNEQLSISSIESLLAAISPDLAKGIDAELPAGGLTLTGMMVTLRPVVNEVHSVAFSVTFGDGEWTIGPAEQPYCRIQSPVLDLLVQRPLDAESRGLAARISGSTELFGEAFSAAASLPGPVLSAKLTGSPIELSRLLDASALLPGGFSPKNLPGVAGLAIKTMGIRLDANAKTLYLEGGLEGHLAFELPGAGPFGIDSPAFRLRTAIDDPASTILGFRGTADVAGAKGELNFTVSSKNLYFAASTSAVALDALVEKQLGLKAALPKLTLVNGAISVANGRAALGGELASDIELPVGSARIKPQSVWANVTVSSKQVSAHLGGRATFGDIEINVNTTLDGEQLSLAGSIPSLDLPTLVQQLAGKADGIPNIDIKDITFAAASSGTASFGAKNISLDLGGIADLLAIKLPPGMPNPELSSLTAAIDHADVDLKIGCDEILPFGDGFKAQGFGFCFQKNNTVGTVAGLEFEVSGTHTLATGCHLSLDVKFSGQTDADFAAHGHAHLVLFDSKPYNLDVNLGNVAGETTLVLTYSGPSFHLVDAKDVLLLGIDSLKLNLVKSGDGSKFELVATGKLGIGPGKPAGVALSIERTDKMSRIVLRPETEPFALPPIAFPLPTPPVPSVQLSLRELSLGHDATSDDDSSGLIVSAAATLTFDNIAPIEAVVGKSFTGKLSAGANSVVVSCDLPDPLPWPHIEVKWTDDHVVTLPVPTLAARKVEFQVEAGKPSFDIDWRVTVPEALNELIGLELFSDVFDVHLQLGKSIGIWPTGQPNWPLKQLQTTHKDGKDWIELGKALRVAVPHFEYNGAAWMVSDLAFAGLRSIGIPLAPIKFLLCRLFADSAAIAAAIGRLPDSVPLGGINLDAGDLDKQIPALLGPAAVKEIDKLLAPTKQSLESILKAFTGDVIHKLPLDFQEYLKVDIPDDGQIDCGVTPTGSASVTLRVDPQHRLRVLLPYFGFPPGLMGITVDEFRIGECAAGQLTILGINGYVDLFDIVSLSIAVASETGGENYRQRITLSNVFALAPTAFPIPIPLLFKELAFDHADWLGFELHSHWSLGPDEPPGLIEFIDLVGALIPFFTREGYFLHQPGHWPKSLAIPFTIGRNDFKLPHYLGGNEPVGISKALPKYDLGRSISFLLDACKDFNPAYAIQAVPLFVEDPPGTRHWIRVDKLNASVGFGPIKLSAGAAWCVVTEDEFKGPVTQYAVADGKLSEASLDGLLQALPEETAFSDRGFVIFLMGGWDIQSVAGMHCQFGVAYTQEAGFQTGIRMAATLGGALELSISGTIRFDSQLQKIEGQTQLCLTGDTKANLLQSKGAITVNEAPEKSFTVKVGFMFGTLAIGGGLTIAQSGVVLRGDLDWPGFVADGKAHAEFNSDGVTASFSGKLFELTGDISAQLPAATATMDIQLDPALAKEIQNAIVQMAKTEVNKSLDDVYEELNGALKNIEHFKGTVGELRAKAVPRICDVVLKTINAKINQIVSQEVDKKTKGWVPKFIRARIKAAAVKVAESNAKPYKDAIIALKATADKSNTEVAAAAQKLINQGSKKIYGITPLEGKNLTTLNGLVEDLRKLKDNQMIEAGALEKFQATKLFEQVFARIRATSDDKIAEAIPTIDSLRVSKISLTEPVPSRLQAGIVFKGHPALQIDI